MNKQLLLLIKNCCTI